MKEENKVEREKKEKPLSGGNKKAQVKKRVSNGHFTPVQSTDCLFTFMILKDKAQLVRQ